MSHEPAVLARPALALALLAGAQFITAVDFNIVYVALPSIQDALGFSSRHLQWVISAYALAFGGFILLGGRLGDVMGRRRAFVVSLLVYAGSSLAGGIALSPFMLISARAVQGLGGALLFPTTLALITTYFAEGKARNRALSVWGAAGASGGASGALVGGILTSAFGWNWTFFVNVPVVALAVSSTFFLLPRDIPNTVKKGFDLPGAITVTAGVTLLVLVFVEGPELGWLSGPVMAMLFGSVALLAAFALIESKTREPLMPLRLFRHPTLPAAMAMTGLFAAGFGAQYYLLTTYLQEIKNFEPATAGMAFLPFSLSIVVGTRSAGWLANRIGVRGGLLLGLCIGLVGLLMVAYGLSGNGSYATHMVPGFIVDGIGQGMTWTSMWIAATNGIEPKDRGIATGMASTAQQVGNALGLAILVAVSSAAVFRGDALPGAVSVAGVQAAFVAAAVIVLLAIGVASAKLSPRGQPPAGVVLPAGPAPD